MADMTFDEIIEGMREEVYNDVIQEFHYIGELPITDDQKQEIISDIIDYVLKEIQSQPSCECSYYDELSANFPNGEFGVFNDDEENLE